MWNFKIKYIQEELLLHRKVIKLDGYRDARELEIGLLYLSHACKHSKIHLSSKYYDI